MNKRIDYICEKPKCPGEKSVPADSLGCPSCPICDGRMVEAFEEPTNEERMAKLLEKAKATVASILEHHGLPEVPENVDVIYYSLLVGIKIATDEETDFITEQVKRMKKQL